MANPFYTPSGTPSYHANGTSQAVRSEFALVAAGFAKLPPTLAGNGGAFVVVNTGGTALTTLPAANLLSSPGQIGNTTPNTGKFTNLVVTTLATLPTANITTLAVTINASIGNQLTVSGSTRVQGFGANGVAASGKITISGSRGGATATVLESLLQAMQTFGFVTDSTTP
jgi:hypothetical protein